MMEVVRIRVGSLCVEFKCHKNYLQSRFGTFLPGTKGPMQLINKDNWDNLEFFDYQSKEVFKILIEDERIKLKEAVPLTNEELKEKQLEFEKKYKRATGAQIEDFVAKTKKEGSGEYNLRRMRLSNYLMVTCHFDGTKREWVWNVSYDEKHVKRTACRNTYYPVMNPQRYISQNLGIIGEVEEEESDSKEEIEKEKEVSDVFTPESFSIKIYGRG